MLDTSLRGLAFKFPSVFFPISLLSLTIEINSAESIIEISDSPVVPVSDRSLSPQRIGVVETFFVPPSVRLHLLCRNLSFVTFNIRPPSLFFPTSRYLSLAMSCGLRSKSVFLLRKPSLDFADFYRVEVVLTDDSSPVLVCCLKCVIGLKHSRFENLNGRHIRGKFSSLGALRRSKRSWLKRNSLNRKVKIKIAIKRNLFLLFQVNFHVFFKYI